MNSTSTARTILFWISIVFLGTMLWKLVSTNGTSTKQDAISYSEFMAKVDSDDITAVMLYLSPNSYEVYGESASPARRKFELTVPKEVVPDLLRQLRQKNVPVEVKEVRSGDWTLILLNAAPLILLVGFCLFLMRQMRGQRKTGSSVASGNGANRHWLRFAQAGIWAATHSWRDRAAL